MTRTDMLPLPSRDASRHGPLGLGAAALIVLAMVAARLVAAIFIPLAPDEAYYFDWSRFPSWSYYDHPAMGAWWITAGTWLFGVTPLGIRAIAVLSALPISFCVFLTGEVLFDRATAIRGALWTNATFLIAVGSVLATPDAPSVLFWAVATLGLALLVKTGRGGCWLLIGLAAGLGVISKLTTLFLGPAILLVLVIRPPLRKWLVSPWLWAGGVLALAVTTPMLVWNDMHGWVTLSKQFGRLGDNGFDPLGLPTFLLTQFGVLNPLVAVFAMLGAVIAWRKRSDPRAGGMALLLWTALPLIAYLGVHSFQEQIQGHWLAPIFPTLALVAAAAAESADRRWGPLASPVLPVGVAAMAVGFLAGVNPGNVLPKQLDVGQVIRGWDSFAQQTEQLARKSGAEWVAASYYGVYSELTFHLAGSGTPVIAVEERARYAYAPPPDPALVHKPVLVIARSRSELGQCFVNLASVGTIRRAVGSRLYETYEAFRADGAAAGAFNPGCDAQTAGSAGGSADGAATPASRPATNQ